mmetsp:Transcript_13607/g.31620  ORF Transcript_13607/g.31620 Transcript_13607/m.31620 type:complete len:278 (+) Transcript_13607:296-1129(+)
MAASVTAAPGVGCLFACQGLIIRVKRATPHLVSTTFVLVVCVWIRCDKVTSHTQPHGFAALVVEKYTKRFQVFLQKLLCAGMLNIDSVSKIGKNDLDIVGVILVNVRFSVFHEMRCTHQDVRLVEISVHKISVHIQPAHSFHNLRVQKPPLPVSFPPPNLSQLRSWMSTFPNKSHENYALAQFDRCRYGDSSTTRPAQVPVFVFSCAVWALVGSMVWDENFDGNIKSTTLHPLVCMINDALLPILDYPITLADNLGLDCLLHLRLEISNGLFLQLRS